MISKALTPQMITFLCLCIYHFSLKILDQKHFAFILSWCLLLLVSFFKFFNLLSFGLKSDQ
ncbi:hypothetical protein L931_04405 [Helicobacter pylori PZ5024]|uniref:Uncharacterized protein n=1 Tax=Helicobacter pylori PZ5024 TaxID=1337391 RepID=T2T4T0_HELPX|nr:hypothetical protein L930_07230 [Helicobacter pylori PZ5004]EQD99911.1 hypothetical protein L931_04405 [Helicobacter pylori PZ5024]